MYVSGHLSDVENVIVDIGTGYYVEKVSFPGSSQNGAISIWLLRVIAYLIPIHRICEHVNIYSGPSILHLFILIPP